VIEQLVMQSERLGSTLKIRARHSATHAVRAGSQLAAAVQLAQLFEGCAVSGHGATQTSSNSARTTGRDADCISISASGGLERRIDGKAVVSALEPAAFPLWSQHVAAVPALSW
jgi:hypothetical protein